MDPPRLRPVAVLSELRGTVGEGRAAGTAGISARDQG
jgi:hypothetical protein